MKISIPETVNISCSSCDNSFGILTRNLAGRTELFCPACGEPIDIYSGLDAQVRRRMYQAVRNEIERNVYNAQQEPVSDGS